ncbi:MAG TPA: DNA gyrase/topoisomerase IV subunit A [Bacteroidales bacterium]|nr:DNA gyrase/topoisomerase IV subunit A [Bacteroidales bacterium]HSA43353.1 DNA gyrase/topoisomerase IV subunit A [Bacteroidales bacterium]
MAEEAEEIQENALNGNGDHPVELSDVQKTIQLSGMFENWFLDYASYVIQERAVPDLEDGLKPVQRRLLHAMKDLDDGRYNKVANIIGHTMKYHPHGDASIGDALVQMGQKDILIDTQGNWGNILTGDNAAAPRYIEARLSRFANEVVFNPKTTAWKPSYDGRNNEPVTLPVKFPLLLAQGAEGIAVGLASKILPHNFLELIQAAIDLLHGISTPVYPDFPTGGYADFSRYNDGLRGGRVRIRARIQQLDKKALVISEVPFGTTTGSLIDSILAANDKGKIKIRKIDDNTAGEVEITVHLAQGVSPDTTIDALYAFTDCEVSVSPNSCVIDQGKPRFMGITEILAHNTERIRFLLQKELEIRLAELKEQWHFSSLEKIFIEKRIYLKIEKCETWESVIETIDLGLNPYKKKLKREVTREDIIRLTEIKIKRISRYDAFRADEHLLELEKEMEKTAENLASIIPFTIAYLEHIRDKYGKGRERKTEIRNFDTIEASLVAAATQKLYVSRTDGFAGTGLKKDEFVCECSDIDDIIVFREDGTFIITRVSEKVFVGENIIHIAVFKRNDDRTIYNMIYQDGKQGLCYVKRFAALGISRDKEYSLTRGTAGSRVVYFSANPNGEAEVIQVFHKPKPKLKKLSFDFDFSSLAIKGRQSYGNILSKHLIRKVVKKEAGISTLSARNIWFDESIRRLNADARGILLGAFDNGDKIISVYKSGYYKLTGFDLNLHFDEDLIFIEQYLPGRIFTVLYLDRQQDRYYVKRFQPEQGDRKMMFLTEDATQELVFFWAEKYPVIRYKYTKKNTGEVVIAETELADFIAVKGYKARGKRLSEHRIVDLESGFRDSGSDDSPSGSGENTESGPEDADLQAAKEQALPPAEHADPGIQMTIEFNE